MAKRVILVHGWEGNPENCWFPWLKKELEARGFEVLVPAMPDPGAPRIDTWVPHLLSAVGDVDENTYFMGHSVGCQTIMHYLESLPEGKKVGGAVFVGGWFLLNPVATPSTEDMKIYKQWRDAPNDAQKILGVTKNIVVILSDNDPYVDFEKNAKLFKEKLSAKLIVEHNKGHFSDDVGVIELPSALRAILDMSYTNN